MLFSIDTGMVFVMCFGLGSIIDIGMRFGLLFVMFSIIDFLMYFGMVIIMLFGMEVVRRGPTPGS